MKDEKQPPLVDLHESEWRRDGKYEPILGPNGKWFLMMIPVAIASSVIAHKAEERFGRSSSSSPYGRPQIVR